MAFRQDCLFYRQVRHLIMGTLLLLGVLILCGSPLAEMPALCLILYTPLLTGLAWCGFSGSYIRIDEKGIRCTRRRKVIWTYEWHEIQTLRCGRMNRYPIITVIPVDPPVQDLLSPQAPPRLYFQADRGMRQQIKSLCRCPFEE